MSVHYKFKSSLDFDTITFDGLHISVNDFRKAVVQQKRLGKTNDFELQITNAQTKEEYENDNDLIPKNTSLIISRIPQTSKKSRDTQNQSAAPSVCHVPKFDNNNLDLSQMNASEEDKIQAMMAQSTVDYDPRGYQKIRCPGQTGEVPPTYRCYKCHQTGHWIKNCPLPHSSSKKSEIRRNTGIPKSFLQEKGIEKESVTEEIVIVEKQAEVPDELVCSICKDIFRDAVMIPCCGSSFCDDCVRTALLESEENECPDCKEKGTSPGSLIPNRFLRSSVNTFKNETGYERKRKNNGVQETVIVAESTPEPVIEKNMKVESPEKKSPVQNTIKDEIDIELTPPKQSPEKEVDVPVKEEDVKPVKPEVKDEYSFDDTVESDSPKQQVEVVLPQRDVVHTSEVQIRPDDNFKQSNPANFSNYGPAHSELTHRPSNVESSYPVRSDTFMRHSKHGQMVPPHMNYCNNYGNRTERYYYSREPFNMNTAPYPFMPNNRCRQMTPHSNIQPYYQGMTGTIEPGIIEDPLEAFNRIMKEKEKRKELKRIASDRNRSNAVKRAPRDTSPIMEKRVRHRTSPLNERRNRSPLRPEKPPRNSERDKNIRVHRSHYSSNKRSFSRSNSPPQRRYSKSPRRRSRSRSHPRSHSREYDTLRHDGRSSKHTLQQSHRGEHEKEHTRFIKKPSGRFSETRTVSDIIPKENRRHNSKLRENGNTFFDSYPKSSRKTFVENDNLQENRDTLYEFDEKRNKAPVSKPDEGIKSHRKIHETDGDREKQHSYLDSEMPKQESERKTKERKKKKDKDEKTEKKSKKEKKDKKKREKNKEDIKKHSQHSKTRKESSSALTSTAKGNEETINSNCTSRDPFKSSNEESFDDRHETFTPDININRNMEIDKVHGEVLYENRLDDENNVFKNKKSPKYAQHPDNNCSELNTPTSFVDTTPENYAGKWDNFDFSVPNSDDIKGENERDCEYDQHMFQNYPSNLRNEQFDSTKHLNKKKDVSGRLQNDDRKVMKNEEMCSDKRSEFNARVTPRRPSPVPSEAVSSSTNNSNTGKNSQSKKRRKKSKHKKDKQYYKRSSSADSSRHSRKSASKHKKSKSDKKKKTRRNESR